jgi:uncharacterized delta-60 repeat protein
VTMKTLTQKLMFLCLAPRTAHMVGRSVGLLLLFSALNPQAAKAQAGPGALDTTFAGSGMSRVSFGGAAEGCAAAVVQADGKLLLVGGGHFGSDYEFEVIRLGTNNVLDNTFGAGGVVLTPFFDEPMYPYASAGAAAIQADNKIVAAGTASFFNGSYSYFDFAVARYNLDGSLDSTFGSGGRVVTDLGGFAAINALVIQRDGKLVVAGYVNTNFALARYQTNGVLDSTFGIGGTLITDVGGGSGSTYGAAGLLLQPDGKLIAVGTGMNGAAFAVLRYTTNGVLDTSFGSGGIVYTAIPGALSSFATCVAYESSFFIMNPSKFVVAGNANNNSWSVSAVLRYNLDGTLDSTFGSGGIVTNVFAPGANGAAWATAVVDVGVLGTGHKITVAGSGNSGGVTYFGVARLLGGGALDTTFGSGGSGMVALSFGAGHDDEVSALVMQAGEYVLAGESFADTNGNGNFAAARFTSGGVLDTSFGNAGVASFDFAGQSSAQAVAIQPDGRIIAAGGNGGGAGSFALARYNPDGSLDPSFGSFGRVTTVVGLGASANAMQLQPDGRIVTAGQYYYTNVNGNVFGFALARHNANGSLDTSFGTGGKVTTSFGPFEDMATGLALQADGKIVAVGSTLLDLINDVFNIAVARYTTNGLLDTSFGGTGKVVTQVASGDSDANAVVIQTDGKILVGGSGQVGTNHNFALLRFLPNGSLDNSFGSFGRVTTDFGATSSSYGKALALQPDGKIILAGYVMSGSYSAVALARYNSDGTLDPSFGTGGKLITQVISPFDLAYSMAVMPDGKILVAGSCQQGNESKYAILRYLPNGSLDGSYGFGGKMIVNFADGYDSAHAVAIDQIGRAVVAGGAGPIFGIVRLASEPFLKITSISPTNNGQMLLHGLGVPDANHSLLASPTVAPANFSPLAPITPDAGGFWQYLDTSTPAVGKRFYRLSLP